LDGRERDLASLRNESVQSLQETNDLGNMYSSPSTAPGLELTEY